MSGLTGDDDLELEMAENPRDLAGLAAFF